MHMISLYCKYHYPEARLSGTPIVQRLEHCTIKSPSQGSNPNRNWACGIFPYGVAPQSRVLDVSNTGDKQRPPPTHTPRTHTHTHTFLSWSSRSMLKIVHIASSL